LDFKDETDPNMKNSSVLGKILYNKTYGFSITATKHSLVMGHDLKVLLKNMHQFKQKYPSHKIHIQNNMELGFTSYVMACELQKA